MCVLESVIMVQDVVKYTAAVRGVTDDGTIIVNVTEGADHRINEVLKMTVIYWRESIISIGRQMQQVFEGQP